MAGHKIGHARPYNMGAIVAAVHAVVPNQLFDFTARLTHETGSILDRRHDVAPAVNDHHWTDYFIGVALEIDALEEFPRLLRCLGAADIHEAAQHVMRNFQNVAQVIHGAPDDRRLDAFVGGGR